MVASANDDDLGPRCPDCGSAVGSRVLDSRSSARGRRRRHACRACGARWTTYELAEERIDALETAERRLGELLDLVDRHRTTLTAE